MGCCVIPATCHVCHNRGTLYRRLQQFEPAVEDFLKSLDMVTDSRDNLVQQAQRQLLLTYNDFAVHCYTQGAYQEGVLLLNKAIRDEQKEKGLYINRGDCFFQLGNLCYAEADYKQALALSPQDEGANLRMGVLQEKMGFLEQKHRQFQTAEDHFSVAIKHNPEKAQYYLHRAKIRQLLQNLLGARQDVATVLLLNPNYPKMAPLISNLFPGMSVEDVLNSEVAQLAKLELSRMVGSGPKASHPQSIVVQRLMERQKARTLMETWVPEQPFPEIPQEEMAALYIVQGDKTQLKREDKEGTASQKVTSLTDSYVDQVSSGSVFSVLSISTSGFEVSTSQEYRSTSNTALSKSSLVKPQFSQPRKKIEHRGLSRGSKATQATEYLNRPSGQRCNSSKAEAPQGPKSKPRKTEAPQSPHSSTTEVTKVKKPSKTRAALSPRQRLRRSRAVGAQSLKPKAHGNSQKQTKRSSRTHLPQDSSESLTSTNESQDRPPERSKDDPSSWSESLATSSSKSGNLLEQNLQLSKSKVSQELEDAPAP